MDDSGGGKRQRTCRPVVQEQQRGVYEFTVMVPTRSKPAIDLVVARYKEDLRWLRRVPSSISIRVYDKGGDKVAGHPLLNVGREAHTYLHHIVEHYNELADHNIFCQGRPFDHVPEFHRFLRIAASGSLDDRPFLWLGFVMDYDTQNGHRLFQTWSKNPTQRSLPLTTFWKALWTEPVPDRFPFFPGAHFLVTREQIHCQPKCFYEKALELSQNLLDAEHCFERCWSHLFRAEGMPDWAAETAMPIYLRPIARLGIGWDDVVRFPGHPLYA